MTRTSRPVFAAVAIACVGVVFAPAPESFVAQRVQRPGEAVQRPASSGRRDGGVPTGMIRGHVTAVDGRPLRGAEVTAVGGSSAQPNGAAITDANGAYELSVPAPNAYIVTAIKTGYGMVEFGQQRPSEPGKRVRVADSEVVGRIDFTLPRAGAIAGRVVDENGDPIQGATVSLLESRFVDGRRQLIATEAVRRAPTDDLGRFRLFGIRPGRYTLSAATALTGPYRLPGYGLTYYPGAARASEGEMLAIGSADERSGVEIRLAFGVAWKVSGTAFDSRGEPHRGRLSIAASQRSGIAAAPPVGGFVHDDGSFEFTNIAPGDYVVQATERGYPGGEFAYQYVSVADADVRGVTIRTAPGSTLRGHIIFEGDARGAKPQDFSFLFIQTDVDRSPAGTYRAKINDDWTFAMVGLTGPLLIRPKGSAEWLLKSVHAGGVDVTDTAVPFGSRDDSLADVEVVLTRNGASVEGSAADDRGQPATDYAVVVFAADPTRWYRESRFVRTARSDADGMFHVRGLPSADYFVAAFPRSGGPAFPEEWQDPAFLEGLTAAATRVALIEGHSARATLRVIK